ncbi:hypothetical protein FE394_15430 [Xenorhabdus sp. Reich]|uniref:Transposase n=1 Tax=Xenorhabdus littoralis TaxID=2582835 RepID=A0ABU4SPG4_9GAMM|nr:hypothetical protein [Xenorhabdus sp. psl]MDX8000548.1 hypothetical protein [Xenorhabdus sp. Reich]
MTSIKALLLKKGSAPKRYQCIKPYTERFVYRLRNFTQCVMLPDEPEITDLSDTTDYLVCNMLNVNSLHQ